MTLDTETMVRVLFWTQFGMGVAIVGVAMIVTGLWLIHDAVRRGRGYRDRHRRHPGQRDR